MATTKRSLLSAGASLAVFVLLVGGATPSFAQVPVGTTSVALQAGRLAPALRLFAEQSGLQIVYLSKIADNVTTSGAPAGLAFPDALAKLLKGTRLKFHFTDATTVTIFEAQVTSSVAVDPPGPSSAAQNGGQIQEILVTANRRRENMQTTPVAVVVFTAALAKAQGIVSPDSLAGMVPGFTEATAGAVATPYIRGVGSLAVTPGDEGSVALYVDDIYYPNAAAQLGNFSSDVDRLEVEKGPQGTIFGRNATGGVIQVFTKDPTRDPTADITLGYANYNTKSGSIYASSALTDKLAANIAIYGAQQLSGWGKNLTLGNSVYKGWDFGGRIKFLWTPDDDTRVLLTLDHDSTAPVIGSAYNGVPGYKVGVGGLPGFASNPAPGFYDTKENFDWPAMIRQSGAGLKVTHDFSWGQFVSITGYRSTYLTQQGDVDVSPIDWFDYTTDEYERTTTQEFQLLSPKNSPVSWITGLYYYNDTSGYSNNRDFGLFMTPFSSYNTVQYSNSYAGFGQATATILPDTHLTAGLRYTLDKREAYANTLYVPAGSGSFINANAPNSPQSKKWEKTTYRFSLDHQFTPEVMGYVGYNRGFKSGVFNMESGGSGSPIATPVAPEVLDAYTIGAKTQWWNNRLRLNTEAFWYQYTNIQLTDLSPQGAEVLSNAGKATIKGIDIDVLAKPIEHLTLTASAEAMDGHYDTLPAGPDFIYDPATGGFLPTSSNQKGNHTVFTPPFSLSASASYLIPLQRRGTVAVSIAWSHTGNYYFASYNTDSVRQPIYDVVNASVNWRSENGAWGVSLWGKNITGAKYYSEMEDEAFAAIYTAEPPATYGLSVTYHFGS